MVEWINALVFHGGDMLLMIVVSIATFAMGFLLGRESKH